MTLSTTLNRRRLLVSLAAFTEIAVAQPTLWPNRSVKVIVPFAAGGTVDMVSRLLGDRLSTALGQPMVIENKPGAGGNIGTELAMRAPADGYTLLISGNPTIVINPHLYKSLSYDPISDLSHVALIATAPNLLVVNAALQIHSVHELVALAKAKPNTLSFSSAGNGTSGHLAGELFKRQAHIDVQHVPFKGQGDAITGVIRGDVAFAFVTLAGTLQQVQAGRLRAIAISSKTRSALAPDVPTVAQAGFPEFEALAWYSVSAPKATSPDILARLVREVERVMKEPAMREKFIGLGVEPGFLAGPALVKFMRDDSARWGKVINDAKLTAN